MVEPNLAHLYFQQTGAAPLFFVGIGLHTGSRATMRIYPANANHGITVVRRDLPVCEGNFRPRWDMVMDTTLCTTIGNEFGYQVATVEHLLSALSALGVDNARIELNGPEFPVMDGSAMPFVVSLGHVGIVRLNSLREGILVRRPVRFQQGESWAELLPDVAQRITVSIEFNQQGIGIQSLRLCLSPPTYERAISPARTFWFAEQLAQLRRCGLALGASIKNAILLREGRVANPDGLRFNDEFVRHKALDVIGDLSLAGAPIIGHYRSNRPGHRLNVKLLSLLMNDPDAWMRVPLNQVDSISVEERTPRAAPRKSDIAVHAGADPQRGGTRRVDQSAGR